MSPSYRNRIPTVSHTYRNQCVRHVPRHHNPFQDRILEDPLEDQPLNAVKPKSGHLLGLGLLVVAGAGFEPATFGL